MNPQTILEILHRWQSLISQYSRVDVSSSDGAASLQDALARRQQIIDSIQSLDAELSRIRLVVAGGLASMDEKDATEIRSIIANGNEMIAKQNEKDSQVIENTRDSREGIASQINNLRLSKNYLPQSIMAKHHLAVIVDSKL